MKKLIMLFICIILIVSLLSCTKNKYHFTLYDNINDNIKYDFKEKHITRFAYFNLIPYNDMSYPKDYTLVIETNEKLNEIFNNVPFEINFDKQIAVLYVYTTNYAASSCKLKKVKIIDNKCDIYVKENLGPKGTGSASIPTTRFIIITLDKINECNYNFIIK